MELWKKMKKNRKGFTLVEIIVVLVILAILAAFTIPAMLGFVDDAKGKASIATAREVYIAAQSASTEVAGTKGGTLTTDEKATIQTKITNMVTSDITDFVVKVYLPTDTFEDPTVKNNAAVKLDTNGTISEVQFVDANAKYKVTIKPNQGGTSADITKL